MQNVAKGREMARAHIARIAPRAADVTRAIGRRPVLAIVATDDADGQKFVRIKQEALDDVDIDIRVSWLGSTADTGAALHVIDRLNAAPDVDGIFLQFPLPPAIDAHAASNAVAVARDVDGSSDQALRELSAGTASYEPAAPAAARDLLLDELKSLQGRTVVIVGGDDIFTRSLDCLLMDAGVHVVTLTAGEANDRAAMRAADAIVVTDAVPHSALHQEIVRMPLLLDAGYYLPPRAPDFIPGMLAQRIGVHLTQYGNVGPLTVAHLAESTVRAAAG